MFDALMRGKKKGPKAVIETRADSNKALRKAIGKRFALAREINGWSQSEAAAAMGYQNSTQLCLIEQGARLPPHEIMMRAATAFSVSIDFLYSICDEAERDPKAAHQAALMRHVEEVLKANTQAVAGALLTHAKLGGPNLLTVRAMHARTTDAAAAIRRFCEINKKKFDDMLGSAKLLHACTELEAVQREAARFIERQEGLKETAIQIGEKANAHPLFNTPEYRQNTLAL